MATKTFPRNYLVENLELPWSCFLTELVEQTRWSTIHDGVFEDPADGKFYRVRWSQGSTENQDEQPWEYQSFVDAIEVELRSVTVEKWVTVE